MVSAAICELGLYSDPYSQEILVGKSWKYKGHYKASRSGREVSLSSLICMKWLKWVDKQFCEKNRYTGYKVSYMFSLR